jgi:hypothetical protein
LWVHGGLGAVVAALFFHVLLLGETWFMRDALSIHHVWRGHVLEELAGARMPGWWDTVGLGTPVAGNPLFGALYPLSWPLALLPPGFAVALLFALHVWIAAAGVARLASRFGAAPLGAFVAGGAFAAGGWATSMVVMGIPLLTGAWTPHVVVATDDLARAEARVARRALALAAVWALQLLAGDPAVALGTLPLVAIVILVRAPRRGVALARVAIAGVAALPLAALVLVPAVAYLGDSERTGGLLAAHASIWSMHPLRIVEWVWPRFLGDPTDLTLHLARLVADDGAGGKLEAAFTPSLFIGAPVLVLAAIGAGTSPQLRWLAAATTVLFVLLALGAHTPFYGLWRAVVLPERFVRYPERHLLPALVVWGALAGVGFTVALRDRRAARWMAAAAAALGAAVGGAWLARARLEDWLGELRPGGGPGVLVDRALDIALGAGAVATAFAVLVAAALALAARPRTARLAPGLCCALILGELWGEHAAAQPTVDRAMASALPAWLAPLDEGRRARRGGAPVERVYRDAVLGHVALRLTPREVAVIAHESLSDHTLVGFDVGEVPGYHTTEPTRQARLWSAATRSAPFERLLDLFDVRWAILSEGDPRARGLEERAAAATRYRLWENTSRRPRAFVAPRWSFHADENAAIDALLAPGLDFHAVRLEGTGAPPPPEAAGASLAPCDVRLERPERVEVRCASPGGGWAVLLDAWSPGWRARVGGARAEVRRAEGLARAVRVPPGEHVVEWRYEVPGLWRGVGISAAAWLLWAGAWWLVSRRRV